MKIAITGGSGFIGSHLTPYLRSLGHEVTVLDIARPERRVTFIGRALEDLTAADLRGFEACIHLAAQTDVGLSMRNPRYTFRSNLEGSLSVLEALRALPEAERPRKTIWMSTHSVYGAQEQVPIKETAPLNPVDAYGASKSAMEVAIGAWSAAFDIRTSVLRCATIFGPGGKAVPNIFMDLALAQKDLTLEGTGEQSRDFLYVGDLVRAIGLALENANMGGVWNIGSGKETKLRDLAQTILKVTDMGIGITKREGRGRSEAGRSVLDITKAKEELGYEPKVDLETGIRSTWATMTGGIPP